MIKAMRTGFYNWLIATSNFKTAITTATTTRLHYNIAPESSVVPFCVFDILTINADSDTVNKFYEFLLQVRIVSNTLDNRDTVEGYLYDLVDASNPTITGYSVRYKNRLKTMDLGKIDNYFNTIVQYKFIIQKS